MTLKTGNVNENRIKVKPDYVKYADVDCGYELNWTMKLENLQQTFEKLERLKL